MPPHPVGSESVRNIGIIIGRGAFNKIAPPPARNSPFLIQPTVRSPSKVKTFFGDTRLLQVRIRIGSNCRHICTQFRLPLKDAFTVTGKKDTITSDSKKERSMYFRVILVLVPVPNYGYRKNYLNLLENTSDSIPAMAYCNRT
jgi:hypothetical protein